MQNKEKGKRRDKGTEARRLEGIRHGPFAPLPLCPFARLPLCPFARLSCFFLFPFAFFLLGCGESGPSEQVIEARRRFQRREVQEALDALGSETSTEGRYLKAVALHYLEMPDAARDQIKLALEVDPDNVKYRGLELRLRLPEGKLEVADELIRLHEQNPSSAAVALFAFWAHGAKRLSYESKKQTDQAKRSGQAALSALKASIALSAETPELQREQLELARAFRLEEATQSLVKKLREAAPDDVELLLASKTDAALADARKHYIEQNRSEKAAMVYANALATSNANALGDREFRDLVNRHALNTAIVSLYAVYLAKSNRLTESSDVLDAAIKKQTRKAGKLHLMRIAVYVPLERGDADLAEQQLTRYRAKIADPLLSSYFEGRILFLRKDYQGALDKLTRVVEAQKNVVGSSRKLATEALVWIKRVLADRAVANQLQKAADAVQGKRKKEKGKNPHSSSLLPFSFFLFP